MKSINNNVKSNLSTINNNLNKSSMSINEQASNIEKFILNNKVGSLEDVDNKLKGQYNEFQLPPDFDDNVNNSELSEASENVETTNQVMQSSIEETNNQNLTDPEIENEQQEYDIGDEDENITVNRLDNNIYNQNMDENIDENIDENMDENFDENIDENIDENLKGLQAFAEQDFDQIDNNEKINHDDLNETISEEISNLETFSQLDNIEIDENFDSNLEDISNLNDEDEISQTVKYEIDNLITEEDNLMDKLENMTLKELKSFASEKKIVQKGTKLELLNRVKSELGGF